MPRPQTPLTAQKLRELARTGAEHALNQLRPEIVAIERTFAEPKLPKTPYRPPVGGQNGETGAHYVDGRMCQGLSADEAILGRFA